MHEARGLRPGAGLRVQPVQVTRTCRTRASARLLFVRGIVAHSVMVSDANDILTVIPVALSGDISVLTAYGVCYALQHGTAVVKS